MSHCCAKDIMGSGKQIIHWHNIPIKFWEAVVLYIYIYFYISAWKLVIMENFVNKKTLYHAYELQLYKTYEHILKDTTHALCKMTFTWVLTVLRINTVSLSTKNTIIKPSHYVHSTVLYVITEILQLDLHTLKKLVFKLYTFQSCYGYWNKLR